MKRLTIFFMACWALLLVSSCYNHIQRGDEYFEQATQAISHDSIIQAYSYIEKAIDEYRQGKDPAKENKAKIFLSLLYFSTAQKDKAYDIVKGMNTGFGDEDDYPLYSNYYRIKAFYKSGYEKDDKAALALIDSVLMFDGMYAKGNRAIFNMDCLNKCEILLNGGDTTQVDDLIRSVVATTTMPSPIEPQIYANMARRFELAGQSDSAYKYAKLVVDKTSKIYEDIDNNLYALDIILQYDSIHNNMADYIRYRNLMDAMKAKRQGESIKYGMAFVKEQNTTETYRLKAQAERNRWIFVAISILLVAMIVLLILFHRHKETLIKNEAIRLECDRLDAEAFRRKLENELLQRKINAKSDELKKANNEILELSQHLAKKNDRIDASDNTYIKRLLDAFASSHPDFRQRLQQDFHDITATESTLACLIKLNLSSEEITTAMSISKSGLIKARYRLRKRLGIESSAELDDFIARY